jgi:hypothetical protein
LSPSTLPAVLRAGILAMIDIARKDRPAGRAESLPGAGDFALFTYRQCSSAVAIANLRWPVKAWLMTVCRP